MFFKNSNKTDMPQKRFLGSKTGPCLERVFDPRDRFEAYQSYSNFRQTEIFVKSVLKFLLQKFLNKFLKNFDIFEKMVTRFSCSPGGGRDLDLQ